MTLPTIAQVRAMSREAAERLMEQLATDAQFQQQLRSGQEQAMAIYDILEDKLFAPESHRERERQSFPFRAKPGAVEPDPELPRMATTEEIRFAQSFTPRTYAPSGQTISAKKQTNRKT